jgi:hypothetical protein
VLRASTDMDQSRREDPKLSEVKAVLHRLQGLSAESESDDPQAAGPTSRLRVWVGVAGLGVVAAVMILAAAVVFSKLRQTASSGSTPDAEAAAPRDVQAAKPETTSVVKAAAPKDVQAARPETTSVAKAPAIAKMSIDGAKKSSGVNEPPTKAALDAASALMNGGRIRAAREALRSIATESAPDALWLLARSYDPKALADISGADAPPDVAEAERWYRAWYAAAVKQGLVADSVQLDRIIGAMQR